MMTRMIVLFAVVAMFVAVAACFPQTAAGLVIPIWTPIPTDLPANAVYRDIVVCAGPLHQCVAFNSTEGHGMKIYDNTHGSVVVEVMPDGTIVGDSTRALRIVAEVFGQWKEEQKAEAKAISEAATKR